MQNQLVFSIESLLARKNGHIDGPKSRTQFAVEMSAESGDHFNRIARISFEDEAILQCVKDSGCTGHDLLILGEESEDDLMVTLWVDLGSGGLPIAMALQSDRVLTITPIYERHNFARRLTRPEIEQVFDHVFDHPELLAIKDEDNGL
jgi:hypothetical protein